MHTEQNAYRTKCTFLQLFLHKHPPLGLGRCTTNPKVTWKQPSNPWKSSIRSRVIHDFLGLTGGHTNSIHNESPHNPIQVRGGNFYTIFLPLTKWSERAYPILFGLKSSNKDGKIHKPPVRSWQLESLSTAPSLFWSYPGPRSASPEENLIKFTLFKS